MTVLQLCDEISQEVVIVVMLKMMLTLAHRVLMVLGAGRGPLVNASLRAARQADRKLKVYAVEKNPNAVITWVEYYSVPKGK